MSKTDKTRPWWVRARERGIVVHDALQHATDGCNIEDLDPRRSWQPGCSIDDHALVYGGRDWGCGCRMCADQDVRKAKRRRERRAAHRYGAQGWQQEY